jgi:endonuclease/exonuclease/phosphatase family metal-dependent hydrolase
VRIATFNVLNGRSLLDGRVDEERYGSVIASLEADVLGLQEVDHRQPRSGRLDLAEIAARAMGAVDHRFVAALTGTPTSWRGATGDEPEHVPTYGIALLSRYPVAAWHVVRLPSAPVPVPHRPSGQLWPVWVRDEPRVALLADVETPGGPMRVATTHLSFLPVSSRRQLRRLTRSLGRGPGPTVLTGDLNMPSRRAERITGMTSLVRGATFPSVQPAVQLDHILCDRPLEPVAGGPRATDVSDHRALVVDL